MEFMQKLITWLAAYGYWITIFMLLVFWALKAVQPQVKAIFEDPLMGTLSVILQPVVSVLVVIYWLLFGLILASWVVPLVGSLIAQIVGSITEIKPPTLPGWK